MANQQASPVRVEREDGIAFVVIDNPPVNATSHAVRDGLLRDLEVTTTASYPCR